MAALHPSRRAAPLAVALWGTVLATVSLAATEQARAAAASSTFENCNDKIKVVGDSLDTKFPKGNSSTTLEKVKITGCDMEITANRASSNGFNVEDSSWTLDGNVHIRSNQQQSRIDSDKAIVQFKNSEIHRITITGSPAQFEQRRPDCGQVTRGHAKQMIYEAGPGVVSLVDDAWLSDGNGREMQSPGLWYDIRNAEMGYSSDKKRNPAGSATGTGDGEGSKRITITIDPKAAKNAKENEGDKKPDAASSPCTKPPASPPPKP